MGLNSANDMTFNEYGKNCLRLNPLGNNNLFYCRQLFKLIKYNDTLYYSREPNMIFIEKKRVTYYYGSRLDSSCCIY